MSVEENEERTRLEIGECRLRKDNNNLHSLKLSDVGHNEPAQNTAPSWTVRYTLTMNEKKGKN